MDLVASDSLACASGLYLSYFPFTAVCGGCLAHAFRAVKMTVSRRMPIRQIKMIQERKHATLDT